MLRGQDTNILVYALAAQDEEKRRIAANILGGAVESHPTIMPSLFRY